MCGRFALTSTPEDLAQVFGLDAVELSPRYNIAPQQDVATVTASREGGDQQLSLRRWGLVPRWADDPRIGARLINARAETVASKPAFRDAFRRRRCLVPCDGFYEWRRESDGTKQPYFIELAERASGPFGMAGLFEAWVGPGDEGFESCTVLTTEANATVAALHHRMPVILDPEDFAQWLDPGLSDPDRLEPLLRPFPAEAVALRPVAPRVNDARIDDAECLAPYEPPAVSVQGVLF